MTPPEPQRRTTTKDERAVCGYERMRAEARKPSALLSGAAAGDPATARSHSSVFDAVVTGASAASAWAGERFDLGGDLAGWDDWF